MTEIFQTNTSKERGDCLQAAIASLLNKKEITDVPEFSPATWRRSIARYFFDHYGLVLSSMESTSNDHLRAILRQFGNGVCLVIVESFQHANYNHAVVGTMKDGDLTIAHDPNPANTHRESWEYAVSEIFFLREAL